MVPDSATTAVLVQRAAIDPCAEVLLECVATGPGQLDKLADGDAAMLSGKLDNLQCKLGHASQYDLLALDQ